MTNCNTNGQRVTRTMPLFASIAALGMAITFALPQAASAQGVTPPTVPDSLRVESGNVAFLLGRGVGTQNYACQPADSLGRVAAGSVGWAGRLDIVHAGGHVVQRRGGPAHDALFQPQP